MSRHRFRIRFRKQGDLRWISHRDLLRTLERLFRRAVLQLAMSEGFHPRPRMSFPSALSVGVEALNEVMELELVEDLDASELLQRLQQHTVEGLEFTKVEALAANSPKGRVVSVTYEFPVPADRREEIAASIERLLAEDSHWVTRPHDEKSVEVRQGVQQLKLNGDRVRMQLAVSQESPARPREVIAAIGLAGLEDEGHQLTRTIVQIEESKAQ